jgi:hypothetical protein
MKRLLLYIAMLFLLSCDTREIYKYQGNKKSKNFTFKAATIFKDEIVTIKYNNDIILRHVVDSIKGYFCYREFLIPMTDHFTISISTTHNGKKYIDTTFYGSKAQFSYHLIVTQPYPFNWKDYFNEGSPVRNRDWGYLPIDSSLRNVIFVADTVCKNTWTDSVD